MGLGLHYSGFRFQVLRFLVHNLLLALLLPLHLLLLCFLFFHIVHGNDEILFSLFCVAPIIRSNYVSVSGEVFFMFHIANGSVSIHMLHFQSYVHSSSILLQSELLSVSTSSGHGLQHYSTSTWSADQLSSQMASLKRRVN